jgi:uncharacterized protein
MLNRTFCHLHGIAQAGERRLWETGLLCWDDLDGEAGARLGARRRESVRRSLEHSRAALAAGDARFFLDGLRGPAAARLLPDFRDRIGYVDIETTGLSAWSDITTIALYGDGVLRLYVRGHNLEDFASDVRRFDVLVTYNGTRFDLPFLRRAFGDVLPAGHIDLCPVLRSLGYTGGLKRCERQLGVKRQVPVDLDGCWAVAAWYRHRTGNRDALVELLRYNAQDALSLEQLLVYVYNKSMDGHPRSTPMIDCPQPNISSIDNTLLFFDNPISATYCG